MANGHAVSEPPMTDGTATRNVQLVQPASGAVDRQAGFARSLAVVIGINDYSNAIPALKTPSNDARRVAAALQDQQQYEVLDLLTTDVTRDRLVRLFSTTLPALNLGAQDRLLIYFAGHGMSIPSDEGEPEYYLVPQDARPDDRDSFLPMRLLREWLLALECRHLLVVLDCCFAGGFGRLRGFEDPPPKVYRQRFDFYVRSPAWQVIASAAFDETALDTVGGYVFGRRQTGVASELSPFALALSEGLAGRADANPPVRQGLPPGDGLITATELYAWVRDRVQALAGAADHRQSPGLWPLPKHRAGEFVFRNPQRALVLEDAPALTAAANPYRGLSSYDEQHSHLFFGRVKQIAALAGLVAETPFVAVLGASGTGKSSLAKAGLIPALGGSHRAGDRSERTAKPPDPRPDNEGCWLVLPPFRPTAEPVAALAKLLADHLPGYVSQTQPLTSDPTGLAALVGAWRTDQPDGRLVLVIDQFEELVTLCDDREQRQHFQALLANALANGGDALRLIVTLRTDFEPQFVHGPLAAYWRADARFVTPPMSQDDLRQVILGPAWASELYFDPYTLADELINEVIQTPGGLPLLSFTLSEMYIRYIESGRADRTLRRADYDAVGGVIGSLRTSANKVWAGLDDAHRATMARLMLRMVSVEGGEVARRRVAWAELDYDDAENGRRDEVIQQLIDARLVVKGGEEDAAWVEPAHDALVAAWDRLMEWKLQAAAYLPLQRELAPVALRWQTADADARAGLLWDDNPQLPQLQATLWPSNRRRDGPAGWARWLKQTLWPDVTVPRDTKWLNAPEARFVQASVTRRAAALKRVVAITASVILVLAGLTIFALYQRGQAQIAAVAEADARVLADQRKVEAEDQARRARSALSSQIALRAEAVLPGQPQLGLLLALEALNVTRAYTETHAPDAERALRGGLQAIAGRPLTDAEGAVQTLAVSPDGRWAVTAHSGDRSSASLWDLAANGPITPTAQLIAGFTMALAYDRPNPMQQELLPPTMQERFGLTSQTAFVFDPAGARLVAADLYAYTQDLSIIRVWDLKSAEQIRIPAYLRASTPEMTDLALSSDGRWLAVTTGAGAVDLWDLATVTPGMTALPIPSLPSALPPDLPVGDAAPFLGANDQPPVPSALITPALSEGTDLEFADPTLGAAPGPSGITPTAPTLSLPAFEGASQEVAFSPAPLDGDAGSRWLLAVGDSLSANSVPTTTCTVRLWSFADGTSGDATWILTSAPLITVAESPFQRTEPAAAFSPDGQIVIARNELDGISAWRLSSGAPLFVPQTAADKGVKVRTYTFSPRGRWLLISMESRQAGTEGVPAGAFLWDLAAEEPGLAAIRLENAPSLLGTVAFSPDERWLAIDDGGQTWLWDLRQPAPGQTPKPLPRHTQGDALLSFSHDAAWVILAAGNTVYATQLSDFLTYTLRGHETMVTALAISSDNRQIFSASQQDRTTRLWDLADIQSAASPVNLGDASAVALSTDGRWLVAATDAGIVRWDLIPDAGELPAEVLLEHAEGVKALALSAAGIPSLRDGEWLATSDEGGAVTLWRITGGRAAGQPVALGPLPRPAAHLTFSGDGRWLAAATDDSRLERAWLWEIGAGNARPAAIVLKEPTGQEGVVTSLVATQDGHWLAASVGGYGTDLWRLDRDAATLAASDPIYRAAEQVAFTPDSSRLATAGNQEIQLLNLTTDDVASEQGVLFGGKQGPALLAFDAVAGGAGRWLAATPSGTDLRVWDVTATEPLATYTDYPGDIGAISDLIVGPDGRWLAATSESALQIWDTSRPAQGRDAMTVTPLSSGDLRAGSLRLLAISGSGHWLITGQSVIGDSGEKDDTRLAMWNLNLDELMTTACRVVGRNLNQDEWEQFFRGDDYRTTCTQWPAGS